MMSLKAINAVAFLVMIGLIGVVDANAFLKAHSSYREERLSEEDVQTSLLAEVEGTFGEGAASSRVKQLEAVLAPIYAALPKNKNGYLGHATVRYALHRVFVQRHGWSIKGLDAAGGPRNSTTSAGLLKEQVPAYIQDLFEQRLGGRGFGLHELGVLAATIEHLVHSEAITRLGDAFRVHNFLPTSLMSETEADDVLDTYMTSYILAEDLSKMTLAQALDVKAQMPDLYMPWSETQEFLRATRRKVTKAEGNAEQKASGHLDFSLLARVAERIGEQFGSFQDQECRQMKTVLLNIEEPGTGRVSLSNFYKPAAGGPWHFQESVPYLRELGALDDTASGKPRVIISNYITSPTNCIASSSFYSVCCMDECEGLLGHLEQKIAAPEATSTQIAKLVSELSSSFGGSRKLSPLLLNRLGDIAATNGGRVPLHGRLFAQWLHHVFPRECPFPHLSGTTNPQTPDEWLEATGERSLASQQDMEHHVANAEAGTPPSGDQVALLPWSLEEELLVTRPQTASGNTWFASIRRALLFAALISITGVLALQARTSFNDPTGGSCKKAEKFMV